jgi:predicted aspartyl protease
MSETGYLVARIIVLICVLVLVVPGLLRSGMTMPRMAKYLIVWIGLAAALAVGYDLWNG